MNNSNSNQSSNYQDLTLQELKNLSAQREILPEGNKTSKDSWIQALEEYDRSETTNTQKPEQESINLDKKEFSSEPSLNQVNQQGSTEAQNYVLDNIVTPLDQRRIDVNRLEINLDGKNLFKMRDGDVANSTINDNQAEMIKQALNDPTSFKGSIKISNGNQVLLQVKDGVVVRDSLGLTKSSTKVEISSNSEDLYSKYSQGIETKGLQSTKDIAVNALSDGVGEKQVKNMIKTQDPAYKNLSASAGESSASKSLDKIVTSASAVVKNQNSPDKTEQKRKVPAVSRR